MAVPAPVRLRLRIEPIGAAPVVPVAGQDVRVWIDATDERGRPIDVTGLELLSLRPGANRPFRDEPIREGLGLYFVDRPVDAGGAWQLLATCTGPRVARGRLAVKVDGTGVLPTNPPPDVMLTSEGDILSFEDGAPFNARRVSTLKPAPSLSGRQLHVVGPEGDEVADWAQLTEGVGDVGRDAAVETAGQIVPAKVEEELAGRAPAAVGAAVALQVTPRVDEVNFRAGEVAAARAATLSARDQAQSAAQGSGLRYATLALLTANVAAAKDVVADVDGDGANNGRYVKAAAAGTAGWTRISLATLPAVAARQDTGERRLAEARATRPDMLAMDALPGEGSFVGPLVGNAVMYGANLADEGRFEGVRIAAETAEAWPPIPDYLGEGHAESCLAPTADPLVFQLLRYRDEKGREHAWDGADYATPGAATSSPYEAPVPTLVREAIAREVARALAIIGYAPPFVAPSPRPAGAASVPVLDIGPSRRSYVSMQIPGVGVVYPRMFRAEYGINVLPDGSPAPPGSNGEAGRTFTRVSVNTLDGPGHLLDWRFVGSFFNPGGGGCEFPMFLPLHDGRLLATFTASGDGMRLGCAAILKNPLTGNPADPASWQWGPVCPIDVGYINQPAYHRGEIRAALAEPVTAFAGVPVDQIPSGYGTKICRLLIVGDTVIGERIDRVPAPEPRAALSTFQEPSAAPVGPRGMLVPQRTEAGYYLTRTAGDGAWSAPEPMPGVPTIPSKADLSLTPRGNHLFLFNHSLTHRENMAAAISRNGVTGAQPWEAVYVFDPRGRTGPRVAYPGRAFDVRADGTYTGRIWVPYDRGRGKAAEIPGPGVSTDPADASYWARDLIIAELNEDRILAGDPSVTLYTTNS